MRSIDILVKFLEMCPTYSEQISKWGPSGKNQINVILLDRCVIRFMYNGPYNWKLETLGFEED